MKWKFVFVLFITCAATKAENELGYCCTFDTSVSFAQWTNGDNSTDFWKWSGYIDPLTTDIPNFYAESGYIWMENLYNDTSTKTAVFRTFDEDTVINEEDVISMSIYRHILDDDGSYRPKLRFVSDYGTFSQDILWSFSQDNWVTEQVKCGRDATECCLSYPCIGYFEIVGTTMAYDELLGIDFLSINLDTVCDGQL